VELLEDRTVLTAVAVPSGVVSWWTANNTANDVYGLNNATLYNVTYATGEVGQAFNFNGSNGWAALGDPSSLAFTQSFTIEGWIKVNGLPTGYNGGSIMFRGDDRPGLDPYSLVILPNGDLQFQICGTSGGASIEAPVPMGQFVHVAATLDDGTGAMTLYENGAVVAQTVTPFRPFGPLDPTQEPGVGIGNSNALDNYDIPFNGLIDELSVYNRALTAGEVFGIYKAGGSGKVISPIAVDYPSVVDGSGGATTPVTFTITRTGSLSGSLTVNWTTADDTAVAGTDYVAASGTFTFAPGQATQTVTVTTIDTNVQKGNVDFKLIATPAGGASVMGLATILNDDVPAPSGLVSWWTANGTAADLIGNNNGTLVNGVTYATGEVGQAFSFNGTDYVSANTTAMPTGNSDRTMEMWVNVTAFGSGEAFFAGYGAFGSLNETYHLGTISNHQLFFSQWGQAILGPALQAGQWYHIAVTNVGNSVTLYLNGLQVATGSFTIATPPNTQFYIGRIPGTLGDTRQLNGLVDEVTVYNRALASSEIQSIYQAGSAGKIPPPVVVNSPSVVDGSGGATTPVTFTLTRTGSLSGSLTVNYTTADDTAVAGTDYVATSGTLTFADGQATQTVTVTTLNDTTPEPNEDFELIATPAGGTSVMGIATILTDNTNISVSGASAIEGSNTLKVLDHFVDPGSGGLSVANGSTFGPDGNLYVADGGTNSILRYDGVTGEFKDVFVTSGSGGLQRPFVPTFGPDGNLYVSSYATGAVLCYNGTSGAFLGTVASGLSQPLGLTFGPDGSLYIAELGNNDVLRYNASGLSAFITAGSGGLSKARKAVFGPDGNLYVASQGTGQVLRYNGQTGAFIDVFATTGSTQGPMWLEFATDGFLYTTARTTSSGVNTSFFRFNATTGALVDTLALGRDGWSFDLGPGNIVYDSNDEAGGFIDRIGPSSIAAFTVSLAWPSAGTTTVSYATADGTALAGRDYTVTSGTLTFAPGETSKGILVSTRDNGGADPTRAFTINLSNPTGGIITNGQAIGTILDDTKFYVVDGGSSDSTYQYAVGGGALGNNALASCDTAPRGVATTAAGTTEWVVDANKTVYVYNTGGALLGSWSPGGLSSSAQLGCIATNGTDIWLLDNSTHKVYDYAGAASRLSGSQSASSSFSLATGKHGNTNGNGKGIVTDGTSFWVVDGSALKVFKYTLSGSLLGSWKIDPANAHPTGITINPSNVSDIWIVDNGTLKVYQYAGAASRTSGSQSAAATFALAAGDTNPQGIADPPPADMLLTSAPAPALPELPSVATFNIASSSGPSAIAGVPSLAGRDAVFAMAVGEPLPKAGEPSLDLTAPLDSANAVEDQALTPGGAFGGPSSMDRLAPLTQGSSHVFPADGSAVGLLDGVLAGEGNPASAVGTDSFFALLGADAAAGE
jgi:hypothetical protein